MAGSNECDPQTFDDGLKALSPMRIAQLRLSGSPLE